LFFGLIVGYHAVFRYYWSGHYSLTIHVAVTGEQPVWVCCIPRGESRAGAESRLAELLDDNGELDYDGPPGGFANPFTGKPLQVSIWLDGRYSPVFGEMDDDPRFERYLMVIAKMPDGHRVGRVADIPKDYKKVKEVEVELP
jgi:hypothetical protein